MRQAISTRYLGPTNHKGSRVKATCEARSFTLEWNDAFNAERNHKAAALALASKLGWRGTWYGGALKGGGYCFICDDYDGFKLED